MMLAHAFWGCDGVGMNDGVLSSAGTLLTAAEKNSQGLEFSDIVRVKRQQAPFGLPTPLMYR